ncbi:DUF6332 family protein [Streptomyces sp. SAJ15]|uniref:DUF6332 family protein n=1 Tax=Streptomyces sp. SAJ15 TaxID=2011095 RepID=UPI0011865BD5|nr:DUF6332 family protein [Streptomyces sp. SAJ15]TVL93326.1 hypothetical protein CD790_09515 [Streptomyces sp. SAJ15]
MARVRNQAGRDALTVEIVFAVFTGALLAAPLFVAVASPALFGDPDEGRASAWIVAGAITAAAGFTVRVVRVLRRFSRAERA